MPAPAESSQRDWQLLSKKFGKSPFFTFSPVIEETSAGLSFKSRTLALIATALGFFTMGPAIIVLLLLLAIEAIVVYVFIPVAILSVLAGFYTLLRRRKIIFDTRSEEIIISYGVYPFIKHVRLSSPDFHVSLSARTRSDDLFKSARMCVDLSPLHPSQPKMWLRASHRKKGVLPIYEKLSQLLPGQPIAKSPSRMAFADGTEIEVCPVADPDLDGPSLGRAKLLFRTVDLAILKPIFRTSMYSLVFFAIGVLLWMALLYGSLGQSWLKICYIVFLAAFFTITGIVGFLSWLAMKPIVFDRQQGQMFTKDQQTDVFSTTIGTALDDIVALQLCSRFISGRRSSNSYISYQLNLILTSPPGRRINLMEHGDETSLRRQAKRLAEFLDKPLLDHTSDST